MSFPMLPCNDVYNVISDKYIRIQAAETTEYKTTKFI